MRKLGSLLLLTSCLFGLSLISKKDNVFVEPMVLKNQKCISVNKIGSIDETTIFINNGTSPKEYGQHLQENGKQIWDYGKS